MIDLDVPELQKQLDNIPPWVQPIVITLVTKDGKEQSYAIAEHQLKEVMEGLHEHITVVPGSDIVVCYGQTYQTVGVSGLAKTYRLIETA